MGKILVIDDEALILESFVLAFPEHEVITCDCAASALDVFPREEPDVVLVDIRLPDLSGLELFEKLHALDNRTPIVLMTGKGSAGTAIEAMRMGAFEYVLKPLDPDSLIPLVESALETSRLMRVPAKLPGNGLESGADVLIGRCAAMQEVYRAIGRVASQNVTVLILGESGTGKEVIARAIYHYSERAQQPFLAINCAAIPESLLESELFGHEKGAFTGADHRRIGKFEQCSGGTLFLDEIGDMPLLMQTKILRVLQEQVFERVGGTDTIRTDVRVIAATNRDLEAMIQRREFRSDLFYRLNVYAIQLPPLRERVEDIQLLTERFCEISAREMGKDFIAVAPETLELLQNYRWPGNVREMQSVIKHAILQATGPVLVPAFLPEFLRQSQPVAVRTLPEAVPVAASDVTRDTPLCLSGSTDESLDDLIERHLANHCDALYDSVIEDVERRLIARVLEETDGNQTETSARLGITRTTLRAKIAKLGIAIRRTIDT